LFRFWFGLVQLAAEVLLKVSNGDPIRTDNWNYVRDVESISGQMMTNEEACRAFTDELAVDMVGTSQIFGCAYAWNGDLAKIYCKITRFYDGDGSKSTYTTPLHNYYNNLKR
jgi:hypothetical protein